MRQVEVLSQQLVLPDAFRARYEFQAVLGQGGCGKAFRAQDRELSRPVAIKILVRSDDAKQTERFLREGKLLARITDRHVVRVYDLDLVEGHPCLVMELVDGGTLRGLLAEGPLPRDRALEIAWMMLKGLAACHAIGHLLQMERDLPRSRLSLEAHRRLLEQSLAQFERK